jgi:hypothetical protein
MLPTAICTLVRFLAHARPLTHACTCARKHVVPRSRTQCYESLGKHTEAIKCYKRAHDNGDREGIALNKLGIPTLYALNREP